MKKFLILMVAAVFAMASMAVANEHGTTTPAHVAVQKAKKHKKAKAAKKAKHAKKKAHHDDAAPAEPAAPAPAEGTPPSQ